MPRQALQVTLSLVALMPLAAFARSPIPPASVYPPLSSTRLLAGPFREAEVSGSRFLLSLDPDRLLAGFRENAGLPKKAEKYGGWESRGLSGQTLGHYLTALSLAYASTGEAAYLDKLNYCLSELADCQAQSPTGFLGGMPRGPELFAELAAGNLKPDGGFNLNGGWVPWYNQHKLFAGLHDAYRHAGSEKAKDLFLRLGNWADTVTANLSDAQLQQMLAVEHGGMLESLADLYALTNDPKHLALALRFHHKAILDPLAAGEDKLTGRHANTQIPKVIGAARLYELTGDEKYRRIAETFWTAVAKHRSFVTGSNSDREHFFPLGEEASRLGPENGETCNVYNMLKLTSHLAAWTSDPEKRAEYFSYYERAQVNHILGSIDPQSGGTTYFQPLKAGLFKVYCNNTDAFWCCTGTGLENHQKYAEHAYSLSPDGNTLDVNLFVASEVSWKDRGITLRQETDFPRSGTIEFKLELAQPRTLTIRLRIPDWCGTGYTLYSPYQLGGKDGPGYIEITREWGESSTFALSLPFSTGLHRAIDDPTTVAFTYGPHVLAASLGSKDLPPDVLGDHLLHARKPAPPAPLLVSESADPAALLEPVPGQPNHFRTKGLLPAGGELALKPLSQTHHERYAVYLKLLTQAGYNQLQDKLRAEEAAARALAARTVDLILFGEQQPEVEHQLKSEKSTIGHHAGRSWRHADPGGFFSVVMKVDASRPQQLACTYWGGDVGREFDVLIDGHLIASEHLTGKHPGEFFDVTYPIPAGIIEGKSSVTLTFRSRNNRMAGGLFAARMLQAP